MFKITLKPQASEIFVRARVTRNKHVWSESGFCSCHGCARALFLYTRFVYARAQVDALKRRGIPAFPDRSRRRVPAPSRSLERQEALSPSFVRTVVAGRGLNFAHNETLTFFFSTSDRPCTPVRCESVRRWPHSWKDSARNRSFVSSVRLGLAPQTEVTRKRMRYRLSTLHRASLNRSMRLENANAACDNDRHRTQGPRFLVANRDSLCDFDEVNRVTR